MKKNKIFLYVICFAFSLSSCTSNETEEEIINNFTSSLSKNSLNSITNTGNLNFYSFTSYNLSNGKVFDFTVSEKDPLSTQSTDLGTYVRLFIKDLPNQNTTFTHRPDADFDVEAGQYFFTVARIGNAGNQEWYAPFVNSRPTAALKVTVDNGIATFTVIDVQLSSSAVSPIDNKTLFSLSFSININELSPSNADQMFSLVN
ncbi:hypothetical protein [Polaribacter sp.]|uniref:hypothetical protein n=1 Tax=Polaribacter sp. TaxID=1920175 RepID=UPI003F6B9062